MTISKGFPKTLEKEALQIQKLLTRRKVIHPGFQRPLSERLVLPLPSEMSPGRLRDSLDIDTAHGSQDAAHALKKSVGQQNSTITWLSGMPGPIFEELGEPLSPDMITCMWAAHVTSLPM